MTVEHDHLILFTRYPRPHRAKTRLIPALSAEGAASVQRDMTLHTIRSVKQLAARSNVSIEIRFEGANVRRMRACFGNAFPFTRQGSGDLGLRITRAFDIAFSSGAKRVILIGTDCPDLDAERIQQAFDRLATDDLVLGPAADGGYYLIGMKAPIPELFLNISWGSDRVLHETTTRAEALALSFSLLATLSDVDRPEDLPIWIRARSMNLSENQEECPPRPRNTGAENGVGIGSQTIAPIIPDGPAIDSQISVVIPTLNEAEHLEATLESLEGANLVETLVVDGGSSDQTRPIARKHGCHVLETVPNRARQLNLGAQAATGEILLFLHADTRLAAGFDVAVRLVLQEPGVVGGAFRLRIDAPGRSLRLIERAVELRTLSLQMPYGDQGLFVPVSTFERMGHFHEMPIMEDFEFVRRLRRLGRVRMLPLPATTSARRWQARGPWRTTWINQKMILGFLLGISPKRLATWYRG